MTTQRNPIPATAPAAARLYGQRVQGLSHDGRAVVAGVFDENQVRAAAGLTLVAGAVAFVYAYFAKVYLPIQIVTALFFVEFVFRVTLGIHKSPLGLVARWLTCRQEPHWASAQPKRFAWTLGLVMSFSMMVITNAGIRGALPLTICLVCLVLMWLEAVLGLCLGCEIHGLFVRLNWTRKDAAYEICAHGACSLR